MNKKILIDLIKIRDFPAMEVDGKYSPGSDREGLRSVREEAIFSFTCRRCLEAPCIEVCPAEALEKDDTGRVVRNVNLCVRCKSCVAICPFGTLMDDLFEMKPPARVFDLNNDKELDLFIRACPEGTVSYYNGEEDPENHIYKLNDKVMVKEYIWNV